jgi:plasmid stabilization system protein ParE
MKRRLTVRPRALRELADAIDWYNGQRPGHGEVFLSSFQSAAAAIADNPLQYQFFGKSARRARLRGFPYGLIYEISDTEVVILACFHGSRNPAPWRD